MPTFIIEDIDLHPALFLLLMSGTGDDAYLQRVLAQNPIAIWKLDEGGGTTIIDSSDNAYDGSYTGVTWDGEPPPMGGQAPYFDGANDFGNVYSAGFASAFDMDEFTIIMWLKMGAGAWTDSAIRYLLNLERDANNNCFIQSPVTSNSLRFRREGNGTSKTVVVAGLSEIGWFCAGISASVVGGGLLAAGDLRAYIDGVEGGTVQTGNIAATGSGLSATTTLIGAKNTTPANVHDGYEVWGMVFGRPMDNDLLALQTV